MSTSQRAGIPCILLMIFTGDLLRAMPSTDSNRWPFPVSATAQPLIQIKLPLSKDNRTDNVLTLQHSLIFDGLRYLSQVAIREFSSYLVPLDENSFEWLSPLGQGLIFPEGGLVRDGARSWVLSKGQFKQLIVKSTDGQFSYEYVGCRLVHARALETLYDFEYRTGGSSATVTTPEYNGILELSYTSFDKIASLITRDHRYTFKYNDRNQLLRIEAVNDEVTPIQFSYSGGLISVVESEDRARRFAWSSRPLDEYFIPAIPPPPWIREDDAYTYYVSEKKDSIAVGFARKGNPDRGHWFYDKTKGTIKVFYEASKR